MSKACSLCTGSLDDGQPGHVRELRQEYAADKEVGEERLKDWIKDAAWSWSPAKAYADVEVQGRFEPRVHRFLS
jgi:hypothetical protein